MSVDLSSPEICLGEAQAAVAMSHTMERKLKALAVKSPGTFKVGRYMRQVDPFGFRNTAKQRQWICWYTVLGRMLYRGVLACDIHERGVIAAVSCSEL